MSTLAPTLLQRLLGSEREPNPRLRAIKQPLDGKWMPSSPSAIEALVPVATLLVALDRPREVLEAAALVAPDGGELRWRTEMRLSNLLAVAILAADLVGDETTVARYVDQCRRMLAVGVGDVEARLANIAAAVRDEGGARHERELVMVARNAIGLYAAARAKAAPAVEGALPGIRPLVAEVMTRLRACLER